MNLVEEVKKRIGDRKISVVFPESDDVRVLQAACQLSKQKICNTILIGEESQIKAKAKQAEIELPVSTTILRFSDFPHKKKLIESYYQRNKRKKITLSDAEKALHNPLFFAASLVANGFALGCVAGSIAPTPEVIRAALKTIGLAETSSIVSSIFLMNLADGRPVTYADCGVVPYPDKRELANIAIDSARTHKLLTGLEPNVAMLSFSTKGSAQHERVELVRDALQIAKKEAPDLNLDGELQFDAAYLPEVARRKAPGSSVAGKANVFIFPNLDAGNIAYKITERLGGAEATGPILQGLDKPMMDLSRGCSWTDVVNAACVAILMGQ